MSKTIEVDSNLQFIYDTQPQGGVSFKEEFYNRYGDSYGTCVNIYDTPNIMTEFWMLELTKLENTTIIVDYVTDQEIDYKKGVNESIEELQLRKNRAKTTGEFDLADSEYNVLRNLNIALTKEGEQVKKMHIRVFVYEATLAKLEEKVNEILLTIGSDGYKGLPLLDQQKQEWQSMFLPYEEQAKLENEPQGMEIQAEALGLGFAHNQTFLSDESGGFFGTTRSGGTVYFDMFYKSPTRLYYNLFVAGDMGSGKSTLLKKLLADNANKGNFIRGYDKSGEFASVVEEYKGHSIPLDGSQGLINMFQVYPTVTKKGDSLETDVKASFVQHISTMGVIYRILNSEADSTEVKLYEAAAWDFYVENGLWDNPEVVITELPDSDYPIAEEFSEFIKIKEKNEDDDFIRKAYTKMRITINQLVKQYGTLFNGTTTIPDLGENPVVFFDIATLSDLKNEAVFDCQIFISLNNIMANVMKVGRKEKEKFDAQVKKFGSNKRFLWNLRKFLIILDECHNILNIKKAFATKIFMTIMSEARKFFGGIALGTQRIERMFPKVDNVSDKDMAEAADNLRQLFGLTQYKILLRQDTTSIPSLKNLFGSSFSDLEYEMMTKYRTGKSEGVDGSEGILAISGDQNLQMTFQVTDEEIAMFDGGS